MRLWRYIFLWVALVSIGDAVNAAPRPNVLFISVDDLNTDLGCFGRTDIHSPNIDRLAARGLLFENAHCPSPKCAPSRAAVLTGLRPTTTGLYDNSQWWRPNLPGVVTLPQHFKKNGYFVAGAGKIHHHTEGNNPPDQWDEYFHQVFDHRWIDDPKHKGSYPLSGLKPDMPEFDWGTPPLNENEYGDVLATDWIIKKLQAGVGREKPFFLALGLYHPHLPLYAPESYFEQYPQDHLVLPLIKTNDLDDLPAAALAFIDPSGRYKQVSRAKKMPEFVQAYRASLTFADTQVGRVLNALDRSGAATNTIIVLWSDHGYHLGEKRHLFKQTLWERATHVPLIVVAPKLTRPGSRCERPVSLVDLFPTINELCGLPAPQNLDGTSLMPLLRNPKKPWKQPALISWFQDNHALVVERWHYIRYADGSEELYDRQNDPHQWNNLAGNKRGKKSLEQFRKIIPSHTAEPVLNKRAFEFDPVQYTWTRKSDGQVIK